MLKPQDVLCLLTLHCLHDQTWTYSSLAQFLGMSPSEVHAALKRGSLSRLFDSKRRQIHTEALLEFLSHGIQYAFPARPGAVARGIPTAHSASVLKQALANEGDVYVWPDPEGQERGQTIQPLYRIAPQAAKKNQELYDLLSLVDAIRVGRIREKNLAVQSLKERLRAQ